MLSLAAPSLDDGVLLETVIASRNAGVGKSWLVDHVSEIATAYVAYHAAGAGLVQLVPMVTDRTSVAHRAMESNWASLDNTSTADVKPAILKRSARCVLCADQQAGQIDHYLPKAVYPEFAILQANLAPACGRCNHMKSDRYRQDGQPLFLHPYHHRLPTERWLTAEVQLVDGVLVVDFAVIQSPTMSAETYELLARHFSVLRLGDLYGDNAISAMGEIKLTCQEEFTTGGAQAVQRYLEKLARSVAGFRGVNHWRSTLMEALGGSWSFCAGGFRYIPDSEGIAID
ncbi:hypothetical protein DQ239_08770 [Blastococcus sp. TF02-09]|uniref:HNH endonuclease n=1 Tax=Blastococcus sp. TF02-09 TaxID=2250576 RepID=UPI000DE87D44|nr:HNH endonuclease [Blastococcus sp. TF02-9]RBY78618.1 hypothetical protein DQ239_08770 [Blastococcus sp. TF02-9]